MTPENLAEIHQAAFTQTRPWSADEFRELLASRFVKVIGDERCFALIRVIADEAELLTIATDPNHQRKGLARNTLTHLHTTLRDLDVLSIFLEVAANNHAAANLYEKLGYTQTGRRKGYYHMVDGSTQDAILMALDL